MTSNPPYVNSTRAGGTPFGIKSGQKPVCALGHERCRCNRMRMNIVREDKRVLLDACATQCAGAQ